MSKKEQVEALYSKFRQYTETAEQHEFPYLLQYDMIISPGYEDLQNNWNEEHADSFIRGVSKLLKHLGIEV